MMSNVAIIDTHCHLDYLARQGQEEGLPETDPFSVLERAMAAGVEFIVNPCVSPKNFADVMTIVEKLDRVYAAVAIHPTDVADTSEFPNWAADIEQLLVHPKVVALGETGLDYYWSTDPKAIELQKACLRTFLKLGAKHDLPVILHDRDVKRDPKDTPVQRNGLNSHEDIYQEVSAIPGVRGIMHCFSGDAEFALRMIERHFYISFAGNLTFKNAKDLQEAARVIPLDFILVETDTPFLSPVPFRGKPNEPARVRYVVEKIAELRGLSYEAVAEATTRNAKRVFGIA